MANNSIEKAIKVVQEYHDRLPEPDNFVSKRHKTTPQALESIKSGLFILNEFVSNEANKSDSSYDKAKTLVDSSIKIESIKESVTDKSYILRKETYNRWTDD